MVPISHKTRQPDTTTPHDRNPQNSEVYSCQKEIFFKPLNLTINRKYREHRNI